MGYWMITIFGRGLRFLICPTNGTLAQWVERKPEKLRVTGSIPVGATNDECRSGLHCKTVVLTDVLGEIPDCGHQIILLCSYGEIRRDRAKLFNFCHHLSRLNCSSESDWLKPSLARSVTARRDHETNSFIYEFVWMNYFLCSSYY